MNFAFAVLSAIAAPGLAQEGRPPPLVEEYPTGSAIIKATYTCSNVYSIYVELQKQNDVVKVQSLKTMGRTLSEADRQHINARLMKLNELSSHAVFCAEGGMILAVHGILRSERKRTTVTIWWGEKGIRDLDFD